MAEMWGKQNHHEIEAQFVEMHFEEVLSKLFAIKGVARILKEAGMCWSYSKIRICKFLVNEGMPKTWFSKSIL